MNKDYKKILELGYDINITIQRGNLAYLYITEDGIRTKIERVSFSPNRKKSSYLYHRALKTNEYTHLGYALKQALKNIKNIKESKV